MMTDSDRGHSEQTRCPDTAETAARDENPISRPLRWGVWGPGTISRKFRRAMEAVEDQAIVAVGSRTLDHAKRWAAETSGDLRTYGSLEELASDDTLDIVYVASPMQAHYEDSLTLLRHGRSVLCEKTVTLNLDQLEDLLREAAARKLFFMEAMWTAFLPAIREAQRVVAIGEIGAPRVLRATFNVDAPRDPEHRLYHPGLGGGSLLDLGVYPVAAARLFLGDKIRDVATRAYLGPEGVDYDADILLDYGEAYAMLASSVNHGEETPQFLLVGTQAKLVMDPPFYASEGFRVVTPEGKILRTYHAPHDANGYEYEIRAAGEALRKGWIEHPIWSHDHSRATMALMDRCRRAWGLVYPDERPAADSGEDRSDADSRAE